MKNAVTICRILLGIGLLVFGANKNFQFMPMFEMTEPAQKFMGALVQSGYLMTAVALIEIITGILLVANKYVQLALILLFPVMLNALLFHLFLDPAGIAGAAVFTALIVFLFYAYRSKYSEILKP